MSTTLTNGLKLPDKGSVDWYADMQSNYAILDGAVGTVAEHTSQIAGKAPAVHTHTKSDITDFPVYGTTAGTICEGNDSRLSDARTPVAHTHTKSDVTDLLNSNFIPSANNTYDLGSYSYQWSNVYSSSLKSSVNAVSPSDSSASSVMSMVNTLTYTSGDPSESARLNFRIEGGGDKSFYPHENNAYSLGLTSRKWKEIHSASYYYNGTAWGLDKANVWSVNNKFTDNVSIEKNSASPTASSDTSLALTGNSQYIFFRTKGSSNYKSYNSFLWGGYLNGANPYRYGRIRLYRASAVYGETGEETPDTSFSFIDVALHYKWVSLTDNVKFINDGTTNACKPLTNNATDLGDSTHKWKTLNGVNPGALSLPDCQVTQSIDRTGWVYDGATYNTVLLATTDTNMTKNGWLYVRMANTTSSDKLTIKYNSTADRYPTNTFGDVGGYIEVFVPVVANTNLYLLATKDLSFCKFYPCLGNVPSGV